MPGGAIGQFFIDVIVRPIGEFVIYVACYYTGRPIVRLISLGRWRVVDWWEERPPVRRGRKKEPTPPEQKQWTLSFVRNDRRYIQPEVTALVGMLFWALVGAAIFFAVRGNMRHPPVDRPAGMDQAQVVAYEK